MGLILERLTTAKEKGKLLELIVEDIYVNIGLTNVARQNSGSQYGFDVVGYWQNECWKAECKNLITQATINDLAPKIIWHIDSLKIDKFIYVSVQGINNDVRFLLEQKKFSFPIEVWYGEYLEKLISDCPAAMERLGIVNGTLQINSSATPLKFPANALQFHVMYASGLPYSYDYFFLGDELIKAYSESGFQLHAILENPTNSCILVQEISVRTIRFQETKNIRVLRQFKQKGVIKPIPLTLHPKSSVGGADSLLKGDQVLEVKEKSHEYLTLKLSNKCLPGFYELIFEITCVKDGVQFKMYSSKFPLHKRHEQGDVASLCVIGKYYDSPVASILQKDVPTWLKIKKSYPNSIKYLGLSDMDLVQRKEFGNTWKVTLIKGKKSMEDGVKGLVVSSTQNSTVLVDLELPIEEELYAIDPTQINYLTWKFRSSL